MSNMRYIFSLYGKQGKNTRTDSVKAEEYRDTLLVQARALSSLLASF